MDVTTPGSNDFDRARTLWFALLLTITNGFMDSHTFYVRGGVFANVQTGNVIFFAINVSEGKMAAALAHVWPILAFMVGVLLAAYVKSGRAERMVPHPLRWTMIVEVLALFVIGFVPVTVAHSFVTVPIAFLAALQMGLFRNIGDLAYLPVATTGNLMRFVESGYGGFVEGQRAERGAWGIYGTLILAFTGGALIGAVASRALGAHAIWLAAAILAVTLVVFIVDERVLR